MVELIKVGHHTRYEPGHQTLAASLALALPALEWRWHGIGMLQAYLYEGFTCEERIHIWSPDLVLPGIAESGNAHDHRFDLASTVVVGSLEHTEWNLRPDPEGDHQTYDFVNARSHNDENRTEMHPTGHRFTVDKNRVVFQAGDYYEFDRGAFHSSRPLSDVVVTVVQKRRQVARRAQVVAPINAAPVPAFSGQLTESMKQASLGRAIEALNREVTRG